MDQTDPLSIDQRTFVLEAHMRQTKMRLTAMAALALSILLESAAAQTVSVFQATLAETNQKTQEVSTEQVRRIVADGSAILVDTRSHAEYVAGHIPNAEFQWPGVYPRCRTGTQC